MACGEASNYGWQNLAASALKAGSAAGAVILRSGGVRLFLPERPVFELADAAAVIGNNVAASAKLVLVGR